MNFNQVWVPKELKQKETVVFHMPIIKKPITSREIYYFILGVLLDFPFLFLVLKLLPKAQDKIVNSSIIFMLSLAIPVFCTIISVSKKNGLYLEERIIKKFQYNKKSKILLNQKAIKNINPKG